MGRYKRYKDLEKNKEYYPNPYEYRELMESADERIAKTSQRIAHKIVQVGWCTIILAQPAYDTCSPSSLGSCSSSGATHLLPGDRFIGLRFFLFLPHEPIINKISNTCNHLRPKAGLLPGKSELCVLTSEDPVCCAWITRSLPW
jgi:hypothetical protein